MCGLVAVLKPCKTSSNQLKREVKSSLDLIKHRGPDGSNIWINSDLRVGLGHVRLAIVDLESGAQPMALDDGTTIAFNGEIYNYIELRKELGLDSFKTTSDTEVILKSYKRWGENCVNHLRGMFAFVIWDAAKQKMFFARDRFGIKPLYWLNGQDGSIYIASEIKALLPFVVNKNIEGTALSDYFSFQFTIGEETLLKNVKQILPAHMGWVDSKNNITIKKYWDVNYDLDFDHSDEYFIEHIKDLLDESARIHMRADVEVGAYVSGGLDSSLLAQLASGYRLDKGKKFKIFNGKFDEGDGFDESSYARDLADENDMELYLTNITEQDFVDSISNVIYHLDAPIAGPGSFPQYMVSKEASNNLKVVFGGQGGDEIFGGYARYLIAYFEKCIQGGIDGTLDNGNFIVGYESIIPNLTVLKKYTPLIKEFWSKGLFESNDKRYFRLINRSNTIESILSPDVIDHDQSFEKFQSIFLSNNVGKESYFDQMTHFDFKTLLPSLLQVEDRMSMAHGLESRVPFLDHPLIEFAATIPANIKFKNGELKRILKNTFSDRIPKSIKNRKDKMGFPVPLNMWLKNGGPARDFIGDVLGTSSARSRSYLSKDFSVDSVLDTDSIYGRNLWALLSLELWQNKFIDA